MSDVMEEVARKSGPYILALIEMVSDETDGAVVLTAVCALVAFVLHKYDVPIEKFAAAAGEMMASRSQLLAKRRGSSS